MKFFEAILLSVALPTVMCLSDEKKELIANLHNTCVAESGVDEALINEVNTEKVFPDDDKLKCYIKCLMVQAGCMSDDGIIDEEAALEYIPDEMKALAAPIIKECGTKVGANSCENAWLTHKCYLQASPSEYKLF